MLDTFAPWSLTIKSIQVLGTLHNNTCVRLLLLIVSPCSMRNNAVTRQNHPRGWLIVNKHLSPLDWHPNTFHVGQFSSKIGVLLLGFPSWTLDIQGQLSHEYWCYASLTQATAEPSKLNTNSLAWHLVQRTCLGSSVQGCKDEISTEFQEIFLDWLGKCLKWKSSEVQTEKKMSREFPFSDTMEKY